MRALLVFLGLGVLGVVGVELYHAFGQPDATGAGGAAATRLVCQSLFCADVTAAIAPEPNGPVIAWPEVARNARYSVVAAAAAARPVTPGTAEAIAALRPDLVVVATYTRPDTLSQLESLHVPLLRLPEPRGFDEVRRGIRDLGDALGRADAAAALVKRLDDRLAAIASATRNRPPRRIVAWVDGSVAGRGTTFDAAATAAGLVNAAASLDGWGDVDQERVVALHPDVIIVPAPPSEPLPTFGGTPAIAAWLRAGGRIAAVDPALFGTASQHLADLANELAALGHGVRIAGGPLP